MSEQFDKIFGQHVFQNLSGITKSLKTDILVNSLFKKIQSVMNSSDISINTKWILLNKLFKW